MPRFRTEKYVNRIYEKYSILKLSSERIIKIDSEYRDRYLKRDYQIRTGEYHRARIEQFRNNYIYMLKNIGASDETIDLIKNASRRQLDKIADDLPDLTGYEFFAEDETELQYTEEFIKYVMSRK